VVEPSVMRAVHRFGLVLTTAEVAHAIVYLAGTS
jgi:hypothetical protein